MIRRFLCWIGFHCWDYIDEQDYVDLKIDVVSCRYCNLVICGIEEKSKVDEQLV